jgi:heat shock protein HslJ
MLTSTSSLAVLTMVAAAALGCAGCASSPTSPSGSRTTGTLTPTLNPAPLAEWAGGTWTLASIQPAGQTAQSVPGGAPYELVLGEQRVSTKADCNTCGGTLAIDGTTLAIGPALACTRAACPTMAFADTYVALLTGESDARGDADSLTLSSPRGVLRFRR